MLTPQAKSQAAGRILKPHEISLALVNKQAELLWPEDKLWYLIQITHVDLVSKIANILYITGETEEGINLEEIASKGEMSMIIAPHSYAPACRSPLCLRLWT